MGEANFTLIDYSWKPNKYYSELSCTLLYVGMCHLCCWDSRWTADLTRARWRPEWGCRRGRAESRAAAASGHWKAGDGRQPAASHCEAGGHWPGDRRQPGHCSNYPGHNTPTPTHPRRGKQQQVTSQMWNIIWNNDECFKHALHELFGF